MWAQEVARLQKGHGCDHECVVDGLGVVLLNVRGGHVQAQHNAALRAAERPIHVHILILKIALMCVQRAQRTWECTHCYKPSYTPVFSAGDI